MLGDKRCAQLREISERIVVEQELMGIGTSVVADSNGFPTPNELGPAGAEALPAPPCQLAGPAVARAVPALHRQDGEAIADGDTVHNARPGQGRVCAVKQFLIERD